VIHDFGIPPAGLACSKRRPQGHGEGVEDRPHDVWAWLVACSVELVRLYSNLQVDWARLTQLYREARSIEREIATRLVRVPQRVGQRLGTELIGQIMDEYATGTPTTQLRLLHEHGITIRHQHRR
jgi:uncharacterized protein YeaO (DUF488 family)